MPSSKGVELDHHSMCKVQRCFFTCFCFLLLSGVPTPLKSCPCPVVFSKAALAIGQRKQGTLEVLALDPRLLLSNNFASHFKHVQGCCKIILACKGCAFSWQIVTFDVRLTVDSKNHDPSVCQFVSKLPLKVQRRLFRVKVPQRSRCCLTVHNKIC